MNVYLKTVSLLVILVFISSSSALAQDETCPALVESILASVSDACSNRAGIRCATVICS